VEDHPEADPWEIRVEADRADGQKCERCWNYSVEIGRDSEFPTVCERCAPGIRELETRD